MSNEFYDDQELRDRIAILERAVDILLLALRAALDGNLRNQIDNSFPMITVPGVYREEVEHVWQRI